MPTRRLFGHRAANGRQHESGLHQTTIHSKESTITQGASDAGKLHATPAQARVIEQISHEDSLAHADGKLLHKITESRGPRAYPRALPLKRAHQRHARSPYEHMLIVRRESCARGGREGRTTGGGWAGGSRRAGGRPKAAGEGVGGQAGGGGRAGGGRPASGRAPRH